MPKLDGISATSMIRKFDHMTPIISMTSNSNPNEIMTYYSSGKLENWKPLFHCRRSAKYNPYRHERYPTKAIHKAGYV